MSQYKDDQAPLHSPEPMTLGRLKAVSVRGGLVTVSAMGVNQFLRLAVVAVMSRLLTPVDFGVIAMTMGVLSVGMVFRDLGLAAATVQRENLTDSHINTVFWINVGAGALATVLGCLGAPLVASFFGDARLTAVTRVLSFNFVLGALAAQHNALLVRQLKFALTSKLQVISALASGLLAVAAARAGAGYWALVVQVLSADVISVLLVWHQSPWRPGRPRFDPTVWPMLSFGGYLVQFGLMAYVGTYGSVLLMGRFLGAAPLGQYSRADLLTRTLLGYISQPLGSIAAPALSRLQNEPDTYARYYLRGIEVMALLSLPIGAACVIMGPDLVLAMLGKQWTQTGYLVRQFAPGMCVQPIMSSTGWLYMSSGRTRQMLRWGAYGWTFLLVATVGGLLVGDLGGPAWGVAGVATAYSTALLLLAWPCMAYAFRGTTLRVSMVVKACRVPFLAAVAAALAAAVVHLVLHGYSVWLRLPGEAAVMIAVYAALVLASIGSRRTIADIITHMRPGMRP